MFPSKLKGSKQRRFSEMANSEKATGGFTGLLLPTYVMQFTNQIKMQCTGDFQDNSLMRPGLELRRSTTISPIDDVAIRRVKLA